MKNVLIEKRFSRRDEFSVLRGELLVDDVDTESVSGPLHLGDQVSQVLDGLDLLLEEGSLQEVGQLGVVVLTGGSVDLKKRQVDLLFEVEGGLNGLEGGSPFVVVGLGDVLEDDAASPHVLVLHELHGVLAFLKLK